MNVTKQMLLALSAALVLCIAATWALLFVGRGTEDDAPESIYYFTSYSSPEDLSIASIENASGSIVLAQANGTYYALSDGSSVKGDAQEIQAFFSASYRLPLEQLVEGASASDDQYGLTEPQAEILLQDTSGSGILFRIGAPSPDGSSYYTGLSGDDRVFLLDAQRAERFLGDVNGYYDLSLYPALEGDGLEALQRISVLRDGALVYQLEQTAYSQDSGLAYFSLTSPFRLLLGTEQFHQRILTSLKALQGVRLVADSDPAELGLTEQAPRLQLAYTDGTAVTIRFGSQTGSETYAMVEETGEIVTVPTAEAALVFDSAADVVGSYLVDINLNSIDTLRLNDLTFTVSGNGQSLHVTAENGTSVPTDRFQSTVMQALNHLSIRGTYDGDAASPWLQLDLQTRIGQEAIRLEFDLLDERRCAVRVNGTMAFWCDRVAVQQLLSAAEECHSAA